MTKKLHHISPLFAALSILISTPAHSKPILTPAPAAPSSAAHQRSIQVPKAKKILTQWRKDNPEKAERKLHIIYWTPADKAPAPRYQQRLQTILLDIQKFYAKKMASVGFKDPDHALNLDLDDTGKLKIHFIKGKENYAKYSVGSGSKIRTECLSTLAAAGIDARNETIVIFCNMSVWDDNKKSIRQNSPYYASGTNCCGTAWQVDSPILELKHLTNKTLFVHDGQYGNISLGKYNTIFIGGIAHELGHALGLPHNKQRPDEQKEFGIALMGNGNRAYGDELRAEGKGAFLTLAHALKLASHPMFSGYSARMLEDPKTQLSQLHFHNHGKSFSITGKVTGNIPPYAILAYMDPKGGGDYNATTTSAIPKADGTFTLHCNALARGKAADLYLVILHANGKATSFSTPSRKYSYPYSVAKDGSVDISKTRTKLDLAPVINAIHNNHPSPLTLLPTSADARSKEIAQRLIGSKHQKRTTFTPDQTPINMVSITLTDLIPLSLKVGYGKPSFDRLNTPTMLLEAGGEIYPSGLFAHANSRAVYTLGKKWKSLTGTCAISDTAGGSVRCSIIADGKTIFKSHLLTAGETQKFDLDLTHVQQLELITSDAGDGNRSDWALWLDLKIHR